jgi:hypothetical protein
MRNRSRPKRVSRLFFSRAYESVCRSRRSAGRQPAPWWGCCAGKVVGRKKRRRVDAHTAPLAAAHGPNRIWCGDFKGWRRTQDSTRIDPLTDACLRYLLGSKPRFGSTECRRRFAPTTVRRLLPAPLPGCRDFRCGG